jgi:hypothetical protein
MGHIAKGYNIAMTYASLREVGLLDFAVLRLILYVFPPLHCYLLTAAVVIMVVTITSLSERTAKVYSWLNTGQF